METVHREVYELSRVTGMLFLDGHTAVESFPNNFSGSKEFPADASEAHCTVYLKH